MNRKRIFRSLATIIFPLFLVNFIANKLYWYYSIWYFDMPMHFWGGVCLGFAMIWFFSKEDQFLELNSSLILRIILGVLFIGVSWEIYEFIFNNVLGKIPFNMLDTISDVFFDLAGGTFATFYFFLISFKNYINSKNTVYGVPYSNDIRTLNK